MVKEREMRWETLDSEYVIGRPWLTARRDKACGCQQEPLMMNIMCLNIPTG